MQADLESGNLPLGINNAATTVGQFCCGGLCSEAGLLAVDIQTKDKLNQLKKATSLCIKKGFSVKFWVGTTMS